MQLCIAEVGPYTNTLKRVTCDANFVIEDTFLMGGGWFRIQRRKEVTGFSLAYNYSSVH